MLKKLSTSNRFKKEISYFQREINKITNDKARLRGLELIKKLQTEVNAIDQIHDKSLDRKIDSERIREYIELVVDIRKEISKMIKDSKC